MPFITLIEDQKLCLDSVHPVRAEILSDLYAFYDEWRNCSSEIFSFSSGSTGTPKKIALNKDAMIQSAILTCSHLKIPEGVTSLLCMPLRFIGAKMVVVRALVNRLKLVVCEPSSHPLKDLDEAPYFAAMTPPQVISSLENDKESAILSDIRVLIIGGGAIDSNLLNILKDFRYEVYSTYGMTETLSHIALRRLSGQTQSGYRPFDGVTVKQAADGTAVISCQKIGVQDLKTNDLIDYNYDGTFRLIGRLDNVINSGGIKIQIEAAESALKEILDFEFNITYVPDHLLGQKAVMLTLEEMTAPLIRQCHDILPRYWAPKNYIKVPSLPKTLSGKPDRKALSHMACKLLNLHYD